MVDERQRDRVPRRLLDRLGQNADLNPVLLVGRRDMQRQQMAERVDRHVDPRALLPLVTVISGPGAALDSGLDRAAVECHGRRLGAAAVGEPEDGAEVVDDGLEAVGGQPSAALLIDGLPGWEVLGEIAPGRTGTDDVSQAVEDIAERMLALAGILGKQAQIGDDELPLGIRDVAG